VFAAYPIPELNKTPWQVALEQTAIPDNDLESIIGLSVAKCGTKMPYFCVEDVGENQHLGENVNSNDKLRGGFNCNVSKKFAQ